MITFCNRLEVGRWSSGHPVFKKVDGEPRFLLVPEKWCGWNITSSTTDKVAFIESARSTNSPAAPEAGPSVRLGWTGWRYYNDGKFVEGDISVTCV